MASTLLTFWKSHPDYWITPPEKQKTTDALLTKQFLTHPYHQENLVGKIIYLDQFSRHFARHGAITEQEVTDRRHEALALLQETPIPTLQFLDEFEITTCLMVYKHLQKYAEIFTFLHTHWLQGRPIKDFPHLQKFYMDTYKKAYTYQTVKASIITHTNTDTSTSHTYDPAYICDSYPDLYKYPSWPQNVQSFSPSATLQSFYTSLPHYQTLFVSLSGGVDSMVMLTLLKLHTIRTVNAIHIVYGNRQESKDELAFLQNFCAKLEVPLHTFHIPYLRRTDIDRAFYESMTRDLRFMVYKAVAELQNTEPRVLLGHIQDDVVENVWTNITKNQHLDHLQKMSPEEVQHEVTILRPFLHLPKHLIYETSTLYGVPYLKNTTPAWSNRGKFRDHFHKATTSQFGPNIDSQMIAFASSLQATYQIINDLLYKPIYASFQDNTINIGPALQTTLDKSQWVQIFTHVCHNLLHIHRPSVKAIHHFTERLYGPSQHKQPSMRASMGANMSVNIKGNMLTFEIIP
jgi:tRNA(Ile)-lysidine synthetase-like protein